MDMKHKIDILRRMDCKVAVPPTMGHPAAYPYDNEVSIKVETIHIPSVIDYLVNIIREKEQAIVDVENATKIILDIKRRNK